MLRSIQQMSIQFSISSKGELEDSSSNCLKNQEILPYTWGFSDRFLGKRFYSSGMFHQQGAGEGPCHRRVWHMWHVVKDFTLAKVQRSQDQWLKSFVRLTEPARALTFPFPLRGLLLVLPPPFFEHVARLQAPWQSTSDRPFSSALTRFSK